MARRPYIDEAMSLTAVWSYRLALFALAVAALSVLILRSDLLETGPAVATFAAALVFAGLAILLALFAFVAIWRQGLGGLGRAVWGLLLALALLAYPAYLGQRALKLPAISDVTTDPQNPPRFEALARERRGRNDYPGAAAALQQAAYPDLVPLLLSVPPRTAYEVTLAVVTKHKWQVAGTQAPPSAGRRGGTIEATARSLLMGFRDDVAIRITPIGAGSRVDVRSASRFGTHDFGANAARLRALLEEIDDAAGSAPEPRPEPEKPAAKKPPPKRPQPPAKR